MAALSIATDLGMGQPLEFALRSCVVAMRLGDALGMSSTDLRQVYYQSLLRYIGCNAETHLLAAIFGDELTLRTDVIHADSANPAYLAMMVQFIRKANAGASPIQIVQAIVGGMASAAQFTQEFFEGHCEIARRLAERFGFDAALVDALSQVYARWDGKGIPALKGEAIAPTMLVVSLAQDAVAFYSLGGVDAAVKMAMERKGKLYAPKHVERFCERAPDLLAGLVELTWDKVLPLEPGTPKTLTEDELDGACQAIADFADLKSPFALGHSRAVAQLAADAARHAGLPDSDVTLVRRAGLLHDVGRVGVSAGIWTKPGALTDREWERVRLHPYYTERVLARPPALAKIGLNAALHRERLDGSGYHRGLKAAMIPATARILAAAEAYCAMLEARPHRAALSEEDAANELNREVRAARLDGDAVSHVLAAAGHRAKTSRKEFVAGLSEREIEVLRLLAHGNTIKQIAAQLVIAPKTVDSHIQHIYSKIGVSTRAGATLFAIEQNLLE